MRSKCARSGTGSAFENGPPKAATMLPDATPGRTRPVPRMIRSRARREEADATADFLRLVGVAGLFRLQVFHPRGRAGDLEGAARREARRPPAREERWSRIPRPVNTDLPRTKAGTPPEGPDRPLTLSRRPARSISRCTSPGRREDGYHFLESLDRLHPFRRPHHGFAERREDHFSATGPFAADVPTRRIPI